jgi:acetyl/propionyl-CoA carboxylase alpha subunit
VPPDYDPLIAKVMADAEDRPRAIARLARGLAEIEVSGIQTTLPFHLALVRDRHFLGAELSTDFVAEHWDGPVRQAAARADAVVAAARHAAAGRSRSRAPGRWTVSVRKDAADSSAWKDAALAESTDRWPEPPPP